MNTYGIIMAGGGGTRFWPLSRKETPKQLLNLSGKELMINETIDRITSVIPKKDIFIVTNHSHVGKMEEATKKTVGVKKATVNFMTQKMIVEFEEGKEQTEVMQSVLKNCKKVESDCEIFL